MELEFDGVRIIGSSIASRFASNINIKYYYLARIEKEYIEEFLRRSENFLKGSHTVIIFLNTNSLASTQKPKVRNGIVHVHKKSRLVRPNRIKTYLNAYRRIIEAVNGKKLYFFCNMARCIVKTCNCAEAVQFSMIQQIKLFQRIEEEIRVLCKDVPKFISLYTHKRFVRFILKHSLGIHKLSIQGYIQAYTYILGLEERVSHHEKHKIDGIHPTTNFDLTILVDMVRTLLCCGKGADSEN